MEALAEPEANKIYIASDTGKEYRYTGSAWDEIGSVAFTVDSAPTEDSGNPVASGGVFDAIAAAAPIPAADADIDEIFAD
jgi:hypothetical protein